MTVTGGQKTHTHNVHLRKHTHPQYKQIFRLSTHTPIHTAILYLLAETHTPTQTHASITSSFFHSKIKNTLSYTRNRYIYSTQQIILSARLASVALILMENTDHCDSSLKGLTSGLESCINRSTIRLEMGRAALTASLTSSDIFPLV